MTTVEREIATSFGPHPLCEHCWNFLTDYRPPYRLKQEEREQESCCRCGLTTVSGIYHRHPGQQLFYCPGHK